MRKLTIIFALLLVTSCSTSEPAKKAEVRKGGLFAIENTDRFTVEKKEAFKGARYITIASFKVGFVESKSAEMASVVSVDDKTRQDITETAYRDFVQRLRARGYRITQHAKLAASDEYKSMSKYSLPYQDDHSSFFSSYGQTRYFSAAQWGKETPIFPGEIDGVSDVFGSSVNEANTYAAKSKTRVINVTYMIDLGSKPNPTAEILPVLSVKKGVLAINKGGSIKLDQHIASDQTYGRVRRINKIPEYEIKANPQSYKYISINILRQANQGFVSKMAALR